MSKIKLALATFLLFGIFTNVQASELKRLCGLKTPSFNTSPMCDEESGIVFYGGPNCQNEILMSVYFANLAGFDVLPVTGTSYSLPTTMPDLYVQLDINFDGDYEFTIPIPNTFFYHGVNLYRTDYPAGTHYIYEHEMDISQYFVGLDPCPDTDEKTVSMRLVQQGSNGGYYLFDPLPYGNYDNIVSCDVFHETCSLCSNVPNCNGSSSLPEYVMDICVDCTTDCSTSKRREIMIDNQIQEIKHTSIVSPNPFSDEVTVTFQIQKENTPTKIEIYDCTGALVIMKSLSSEIIGKRKTTLNLSELPKGVYYLNLTVDETRTTSKIVKL